MQGYELIAGFRRQFANIAGPEFFNVCTSDGHALPGAALSYRNADGPESGAPVFRPFSLELWLPQDRLTNLVIAGVLYQEACEFNEKQKNDGSVYQHAAIEVAEEINDLLKRSAAYHG